MKLFFSVATIAILGLLIASPPLIGASFSGGSATLSNVTATAGDTTAAGTALPVLGAVARALPVAVTAGRTQFPQMSTAGRVFVQTDNPNRFTCRTGAITTSTTTACQAAPGSGSLYITDFIVSDTAGTGAGSIKLVTGTGGSCTSPADVTIPIVVLKNTAIVQYLTPTKVTAVQALCATSALGTANSFTVEVHGYTEP